MNTIAMLFIATALSAWMPKTVMCESAHHPKNAPRKVNEVAAIGSPYANAHIPARISTRPPNMTACIRYGPNEAGD